MCNDYLNKLIVTVVVGWCIEIGLFFQIKYNHCIVSMSIIVQMKARKGDTQPTLALTSEALINRLQLYLK